MLNALIAIRGDTYDRVMESSEVRGLRERALLIVENEANMRYGARRNPALFPAEVHVLIAEDRDALDEGASHDASGGGDDEWMGRMASMRRNLERQLTKTQLAVQRALGEQSSANAEALRKLATGQAAQHSEAIRRLDALQEAVEGKPKRPTQPLPSVRAREDGSPSA